MASVEGSQTSESSKVALEIQDLHFQYKGREDEALRGVNLRMPAGKLYGILGPNGSGKSTTFKIISTQLSPSKGDAFVFGLSSVKQEQELRKNIGVCFQSPSLDPILTVRENLEVQASLMGLSKEQMAHEITAWLEKLSLSDRSSERVATLSGGLARRVELVKSLLHKPKLLLLDEPTVGLDPRAREEFWNELNLLKDAGMTIVVTTHLMDEAELCDELFFMANGSCVASGEPNALKESFQKEFVSFRLRDMSLDIQSVAQTLNLCAGVSLEQGRFKVECTDPSAVLDAVRKHYSEELLSLEWDKATLGDIYKDKTGVDLS